MRWRNDPLQRHRIQRMPSQNLKWQAVPGVEYSHAVDTRSGFYRRLIWHSWKSQSLPKSRTVIAGDYLVLHNWFRYVMGILWTSRVTNIASWWYIHKRKLWECGEIPVSWFNKMPARIDRAMQKLSSGSNYPRLVFVLDKSSYWKWGVGLW